MRAAAKTRVTLRERFMKFHTSQYRHIRFSMWSSFGRHRGETQNKIIGGHADGSCPPARQHARLTYSILNSMVMPARREK